MNFDTTIPEVELLKLTTDQQARLMAKGRVHQRILHINHRDYLAVLRQGPQPQPEIPTIVQRMAAQREAICAACAWNVEWICEHPGCKPCQQRAAGGLREQLKRARFKCAAHKHPQL